MRLNEYSKNPRFYMLYEIAASPTCGGILRMTGLKHEL